MKRLFTLFLISFAALSCEMIDEKIDDLLGKRDCVVFAEGTELSVDVPSKQTVLNYKFESTLDWEVKTDAEWLEIDPMSGKAGKDIKIQIKVLHNKDKEGRTGYADLTLSNDESYRITINQAGADEDNEDVVVDIPHNQIWYTSVNGEIVEPYSGENNNYADALTTFGANIVSNTYVDGKGVIEFDGDVTIIGDTAFLDCDNIKNIILPNSITTIGGISFYDCDNLEVITIPESVTTIGSANWYGGGQTFRSCDNLREFRGKFATEDGRCLIIDNVLTCFAAAGLTEYVIPHSVTTIGNHAFIDCIKLESITIPDSVTTIGYFSFGYCNSLHEFKGRFASEDGRCLIIDGVLKAFAPADVTEYIIPNSVTSIDARAFQGCSLESITIPDSVISIGEYAFHYCLSLTSVTIGDSVTEIGSYAFYNCYSLTSVTIGDSVTTIGNNAFYGCCSLTSITIPDSVIEIGFATFAFCENLKTVYCKAINPPTTIVNNNGYWYGFAMEDESGIYDIDCTIYVYTECVEAYKNAEGWREYADRIVAEGSIPEDAQTSIIRYTTIDGNPITPNNNMTVKSNTYINGEGVLEFYGNIIGDSAFQNCYSLTSVTITDSVTSIGYGAFWDCYSLTSVTIGDSVTEIGDCAFLACRSLTSVTIGDSVTEIGHGTFFVCSSLTSITIPDSVTSVGSQAFNGCSSLTSITIPDSVTAIGRAAFAECTSLTSVTIGDSVTEIGDSAFYECSNLTSVTIPDSVTTIGGGAFAGCSSLQEFNGKFASEDGRYLIIDGTLNSFAPAGLIEYAISDSVTTIGSSAFSGCSSLTSVTIPDSVTTIGDWAFSSCTNLTSVTIPDSVTTIGSYAFNYCSSLTNVTIPNSVTTIGYATFAFCENLKTVYCKAINPPTTIEDNNGYWYGFAMQDESGNICNIDCTIYVPAESVEAYKSASGWSEYESDIVGYNF